MEREIWGLDQIRNLFDLTGKVAIVTGGSGAFGGAAARGLAAYGADVVLTSRNAENLERAADELRALSEHEVLAIPCDATDEASVAAMVARTIEELGRVDILVTGSGVTNRYPRRGVPHRRVAAGDGLPGQGDLPLLPGGGPADDQAGWRQDHHRRLRCAGSWVIPAATPPT